MINLEVIETAKILIALVLAYLILASITGAFQAWIADKLGDSTSRSLGMMSMNPFVHVDLASLLLMPIGFLLFKIVIGLSKPVPILWNYISKPFRWLKLAVLALSQPIAILLLLVFLILLRLLFILLVIKTGFNELLHAYQYIFEAVISFSVWFFPYQLLMALTQIFIYERQKSGISSNQSFMLIFLPLFGTLLLRDVSFQLLTRFVSLINGGLVSLLKIFVTI